MRVEYLDHMGNDLSVVNAARVSFAKESREFSDKDARLISFLAKHGHWTPFAHTAISLRVGAPVPIRTQCFKHKQGLVENEESRRYIDSRPELYIPDSFRNRPDGSIKQGSGDKHIDDPYWRKQYEHICTQAIDTYMAMIEDGVAPEQARFVLPQGVMVNWIWTGNLYSFANFYKKRTDTNAQKEIQEVAIKVGEIIQGLFPVSWTALINE
ncbi:thymidylate synthase protein [Rhizobium phage RHph_I3_11]|nr:thymidylate synthase protein [Rhizobium phage RHph_I3_11]